MGDTRTAAATGERPTPEWLGAQCSAALTSLAAAQQALRCGQMATVATRLWQVEARLRAMEAGHG